MKTYSKDEFFAQRATSFPLVPEYTYLPNQLPSQGIFYPSDFVAKVKPYTFGDVEYLSQSELTLQDTIKYILHGITTSPIQPDQLTFFDFLYLATIRKLLSFGTEKYSLPFICPNCRSSVEKTFTLEDIEFRDIQLSTYKPLKIQYKDIQLSVDVLRLNRILSLPHRTSELSPLEVLALHITSMEFDQAKQFLKSLLQSEFEEFEQLVSSRFYHDIKPLPVRCSNCGFTAQVDIENEVDLIKPFRGSTATSAFKVLDD